MDKKLNVKIDGSSKIDINKVDITAQARMYSGGVDGNSSTSVLIGNQKHSPHGPLSLYPLTVEEIAEGMLQTPPMPKEKKQRK